MELRVILRLMLARGQFVNDAVVGIVIGVSMGVMAKLFGPALTSFAGWMQPQTLTYYEWSFIGIALVFLVKAALRIRRIADFKRGALDLMEELIDRGELGKAQRKHLYHSLALRVASEIHLTGAPPTGGTLRGLIEDEKAKETEVEG